MVKEKTSAILLAAGQGKRMNHTVAKQYISICGKPLLYYSLKALEESSIDEIVLVVANGEEELRKKEIVEQFGFQKVKAVVGGGIERYQSVYCGLQALSETGYVLIHDGARPMLTEAIIERVISAVKQKKACAVGMPAKDTVKLVGNEGVVQSTPDRNQVFTMQTPQAFSYPLLYKAYDTIMQQENVNVTDDAMVVEIATGHPVYLIEGSYQNIKVTTKEDIVIAELFLGLK